MTRECFGRYRRLNGSMVTRTLRNRCADPAWSRSGPSRPTSVSNARGQSSSVPSSNPMMCSTSDIDRLLTEPRQVVGELCAPGRPVVRDVVPPQVQLMFDALVGEQPGHALGGRQRTGGVL